MASEIKRLNLYGDPVVIAVAGVSVGAQPARRKDAPPDRFARLLRPHHQRPGALRVYQLGGSSGVHRRDVAEVIRHIQDEPPRITWELR